MMNTPEPVLSYMSTVDCDCDLSGYLCLSDNEHIVSGAGSVGEYDLAKLDRTQNVVQSVPFLEGLLQASLKTSGVIQNVHIDSLQYFDIHVFSDGPGYWILFIDTTPLAREQQQEQQLRLDVDFDNARRKTGS